MMDINGFKPRVLLGMALIGLTLSLPAAAQSHGGHFGGGFHGGTVHNGGWHGNGWHGGPGWWGVGLGVGLGLGLAWDSAYYGYSYPGYYPAYVEPPVVVEPSPPIVGAPPGAIESPAIPPSTNNWYYCDSARAYYPYVQQCPQAWRMVPAVPRDAPQ